MKAMSLRIRMQTLSPPFDAETVQSAGDALRTVGDFSVGSPARTADDAEKELGRFHLSFPICRRVLGFGPSFRGDAEHRTRNDGARGYTSAKRGARLSILARTASVWLGLPSSFCCSTDSASSAGPGSADSLFSMRLAARIASGLLLAISRATSKAAARGSSQIRVAKP